MEPNTSSNAAQTNGQNGHVAGPSEPQAAPTGKTSNLFEDFMAFGADEGADDEQDEDEPPAPAADSAAHEPVDLTAETLTDAAIDLALNVTEAEIEEEVAEIIQEAAEDAVDELEELFGNEDELAENAEVVVIEETDTVVTEETNALVVEGTEEVVVEEIEVAVSNETEIVPDDDGTEANAGVADTVAPAEAEQTTTSALQAIPVDGEEPDPIETVPEATEEQIETIAEILEEQLETVGEALEEQIEKIAEEAIILAEGAVTADDSAQAMEGVETAEAVKPLEGDETMEGVETTKAVEATESEIAAAPATGEGGGATAAPLDEVEVFIDVEPRDLGHGDVSMKTETQPVEDGSDADADGSPEPPVDAGENELVAHAAPSQENDGMQVDDPILQYDPPDEDGHIHFTRSDGQSDRLPGSKKGPPMPERMEVVPRDSDFQKSYLKKIGQAVAKQLMGLTDTKKTYTLHDLPKNYRLYQQARGTVSSAKVWDYFLYGSKTVTKFRSATQFVPHAIWLLTDPTLDPKNCRCVSDSGRSESDISKEFSLAITPERPLKRKASALKPEAAVKKIKLPDPPIPRDGNTVRPKAVRVDREADLASFDRLESPRAGEIVWVHVESPILGLKPEENIEFWPCIVVQYEALRKFAATEANPTRGSAPAWEVHALGTVCSSHVRAEMMLPYQAYDFPQTTKDTLMVFHPSSADWDNFMRFNPFSPPVKEKPRTVSKRRSMPDLGGTSTTARTFKDAAPALILALRMCGHLDIGWATTDAYSHPVPAQNVENPPPVSVQPPSRRFEGVFWGAERIWEGDFVRLNVQFGPSLPENDYRKHLLNNMTLGADGRGIFMHVNAFHYLSYGVDRGTDDKKECWIAGPVFETVFDSETDAAVLTGETNDPLPVTSSTFDLVPNTPILSASALGILAERKDEDHNLPDSVPAQYPWPPAPSGFKFRPLLARDEELYVNISCLAGRYYPTILFKQLLNGRHDVAKTKNGVSTPQLLSLGGFMPGYVYAAECTKHYRDREAMLVTAEDEAREALTFAWDK